MSVDLHVHSRASDGSDTPSRLVEMAIEHGLTAMALTDHDTLAGWEEAAAAASGTDLELIPGTELSLDYDEGGMHLLVLWLSPGPGPLQDRLEALRAGRDERNDAILEALAGHGIFIGREELADEAGEGSVGRPHIAAVMARKGLVPDISSAFEQWLGRGRPAYVTRPRLNPEDAVALARQSGAVPVLSHPHTIGIHRAEHMARLLNQLRDAGLVGLESIYPAYHRHVRDGYTHLARRFGLLPAGGSDYHGTYKPGLRLGVGYGDLVVPEGVVEALREHAT